MQPHLIVLTSTFPRWPGDEQPVFVFDLCRALADRFHVLVLAPHAQGALERERIGHIEVTRFHYAPAALETLCYGAGIIANLRRAPWRILLLPGFLFAMWRALRCALRELGSAPVVVHAHWLFPQGWIAAHTLRRLAVPLLVTAHGSDVLRLRGLFWDALHRYTVRHSDLVVGVGPAVVERLTVLGAKSVRLMPLGIDVELFSPASGARDPNLVLYVGRLTEEKGLLDLFEAFALLRSSGQNLRLCVVGDGGARQEWIFCARRLGLAECVDFVGWVEPRQLPAYYRSAALCVVPSRSEGFGLVAAEAMACGCPLLASDLPAFRFLDGGSGAVTFFPVGNVRALAQELLGLWSDSAKLQSLSELSVQQANRFNRQAMADSYAFEISTLLQEGR